MIIATLIGLAIWILGDLNKAKGRSDFSFKTYVEKNIYSLIQSFLLAGALTLCLGNEGGAELVGSIINTIFATSIELTYVTNPIWGITIGISSTTLCKLICQFFDKKTPTLIGRNDD